MPQTTFRWRSSLLVPAPPDSRGLITMRVARDGTLMGTYPDLTSPEHCTETSSKRHVSHQGACSQVRGDCSFPSIPYPNQTLTPPHTISHSLHTQVLSYSVTWYLYVTPIVTHTSSFLAASHSTSSGNPNSRVHL